jgi:hypothetical protein
VRRRNCRGSCHPPPGRLERPIRAGAGPCAGRLLAAHERTGAEGGELLLVLRSAPVLRIFALTDVDRLIPNFSSLDEALTQVHANRASSWR